MNIEAEILEIKRTQARIDSKLTTLLNRPKKETWVRVFFIQDLTGWDAQRLRQARESGCIEWRKGENGFEYLLESLNEKFIKANQP